MAVLRERLAEYAANNAEIWWYRDDATQKISAIECAIPAGGVRVMASADGWQTYLIDRLLTGTSTWNIPIGQQPTAGDPAMPRGRLAGADFILATAF